MTAHATGSATATPTDDDGRLIVALDLGSSKIACVMALLEEQPDGPPQLRQIGAGLTESAGIRAGLVVDLEAACQAVMTAVREAERQSGVRAETVIASLTCGRPQTESFVASAETATGTVEQDDLDRARSGACGHAERNGRALLHLHEWGYRLDGVAGIAEPAGLEADRVGIEVAAVTVEHTELRTVETLMGRCELTLSGLLATPYAAGLSVLTEDERQLGTAVIDLGGGTTSVAVFRDGHLVFADALPTGGTHMTLDLARRLAATRNDAERIKAIHGTVQGANSDAREFISYTPMSGSGLDTGETTRAAIREILAPRAAQILGEVRNRLMAAGLLQNLSGGVVLTGGGCQLQGMLPFAAATLGCPVRLGSPAGANEDGAFSPEMAAVRGALEVARLRNVRLRQDIAAAGGEAPGQFGYAQRVGRWLKSSFWDEAQA
jgi:cell division protein FtsA